MSALPWQKSQWARFTGMIAAQRMPHALLLTGPQGIGLAEFAGAATHLMLCQKPLADHEPCRECRSCVLYQAGNHPDFVRLVPEEEGKQIKVDEVREMIEFMHLTTQFGRCKAAIIDPADAMNRSASNGLLKTLEEPPPDSVLFLCSSRPDLLPVTIRSRCQRLEFPGAEESDGLPWLEERIPGIDPEQARRLLLAAGNAPYEALALAETDGLPQQQAILDDLVQLRRQNADPVAIAARWNSYGAARVLRWLQGFAAELAVRSLGSGTARGEAIGTEHFQELTNELDLFGLISSYERAAKNYQAVQGPFNLNSLGLLEEFLVDWQALAASRGGRTK